MTLPMMVSSQPMRSVVTACLLLLSTALSAADLETRRVTAAEWAVPRDGAAMVRMPALAAVVHRLLQEPEGAVEIRYPGGDPGVLWAKELEAWMVALGISSEQIELVPGSDEDGVIELLVRPAARADWVR